MDGYFRSSAVAPGKVCIVDLFLQTLTCFNVAAMMFAREVQLNELASLKSQDKTVPVSKHQGDKDDCNKNEYFT